MWADEWAFWWQAPHLQHWWIEGPPMVAHHVYYGYEDPEVAYICRCCWCHIEFLNFVLLMAHNASLGLAFSIDTIL